MKRKMVMAIIALTISLTACSRSGNADSGSSTLVSEDSVLVENESSSDSGSSGSLGNTITGADSVSTKAADYTPVIDTADMFTNRDLKQSVDLSDAKGVVLQSGKDVTITSEGIYVLSGTATDVTIYIEAGDDDKVQLLLDGVDITNTDSPVIYVKSADKVFVTTLSGTSSLTVSGEFEADGDTGTDGVIFSKEDLVLSGTGTLSIDSSDNGIVSKDSIKVTGGNIQVSCKGSALEAHDAIEIADGVIEVSSCNDGLHAEDDDDDTTGYIYIGGGSISINAKDDGIHATTYIMIDDGELDITASEGIEGTVVQINGGNINISASDDGINAARKSNSMSPYFELNGGYVKISMGAGDTDGVDSNGDIYINGGTIDITGQSTFDYDGNAEYNGGTIIENGEETNTITNQFMGGFGGQGGFGGHGGFGGGRPGGWNQDGNGEQQFNGEMPEGMTPPDGNFQGGQGRPGENGGFGGQSGFGEGRPGGNGFQG